MYKRHFGFSVRQKVQRKRALPSFLAYRRQARPNLSDSLPIKCPESANFEQRQASLADKLPRCKIDPFLVNEDHDDMPSTIGNTSPHRSPEFSPTAASSSLSRHNSNTSMALDAYCGEGAPSDLPVNSTDPSEGLVSVLRNPEPRPAATSPAVEPPSMSVQLEEAMDHASSLINGGRDTAAMHFLASVPERLPEAKNHYAYHSRYGSALLGHVANLDTQNRLGQIALTATIIGGRVAISELNAERIGCYVGVCGSYAKYLQLLSEPGIRQRFIAKNSKELLDECEDGAKAGLVEAILEICLFINWLTQCNSNLASTDYMKLFVEPDDSTEAANRVLLFRDVQANCLYNQYTKAGEPVRLKLRQTGEPHTDVWFAWGIQERRRFLAMPEVASALAIPHVVAQLPRSVFR